MTQGSTAAREFAAAQWLSEDETARLCVIVEEWLANLYEHGGVRRGDTIDLSLESVGEGIRLTVTDPGTQFDPRQVPLAIDNPDRGGGAGIEIMRAWAAVESYERVGGRNRLVLLLPINWQ